MRGEDAVERAVGERERHGVAAHDAPVREPGGRDLHHRRALVEAGDVAAQVARDEPGPARDVERARRRERAHRVAHGGDLVVPARPLALGEHAATEPPVVVLRGALLVVRAHARVDHAPPGHVSIVRSAVRPRDVARLRSTPWWALALAAVLVAGAGLRVERAVHHGAFLSTDERAYAALGRALSHGIYHVRGMDDPLHWPPGTPLLFAAARKVTGAQRRGPRPGRRLLRSRRSSASR